MQNIFNEIEKELPLTMERETDCREIWPARWAMLKNKENIATVSLNILQQRYNKIANAINDALIHFDTIIPTNLKRSMREWSRQLQQ